MNHLRYEHTKGFDFSCLDDYGLLLSQAAKKKILYPFKIQYKESNIMYANSGVGIRERINTVDNAIIAASKV
jgi:hypothetical protein